MKSVAGRRVLGASLVVGGVVMAVLGGGMGVLARTVVSSGGPGAMIVLVLAIVLVGAGMRTYRWGKRIYRSGPQWDDPRAAILYLRSFESDRRGRTMGLQVPTIFPTNFHTEAEQLALPFKPVGPFELIRPPHSKLPDLPGVAIRLDDAVWQRDVEARIRRARLVLLRAGVGDGLQWEVETCLARLTPERLILVVPGHRGTREYEQFLQLFRDRFPRSLPQYTGGWREPAWVGALIWFMPDWQPRLEKVHEPLVDLGIPLARGVEAALRPYREQYGIQVHASVAAPVPRILASCVDVAVVALLFAVASASGDLTFFELFSVASSVIYFVGTEVSALCGTLGKRVAGLQMVGHGGLRISLTQSLLRFFAKSLSVVCVVPAVLSFVAVLRGRRTLHDMLAGTFVEQRTAPALPASAAAPPVAAEPALW